MVRAVLILHWIGPKPAMHARCGVRERLWPDGACLASGFGLLFIFLLVLISGFFVATESAMIAVRRSRLDELVAKGDLRARAAVDVVTHLDIYLAACQLGITMASLGLGWLGEPVLARLLEPLFKGLAGSFASAASHSVAIAVAFILITALQIVVGELAPKGIALQKTEGTALWVAGPIRFFYLVFRWPTRVLNRAGGGLLRLFGLKPATSTASVSTVGELEMVLKSMQREGVIGEREVLGVMNVFGAAHRSVREVMTPRTDIVCVDKGMTVARFLEFNARQTYSHFPSCDATLDDVTGIVAVKDVLRALGDEKVSEDDPVSKVARPLFFVPESKEILELMDEMRREGRVIALVVDEFGGVSGLVTFKQLVGEIVGQMKQEGAQEPIRRLNNELVQVDGATRVRDANISLGLKLPERDEYDTIAGLVLARLGHIPRQGETVTFSDLKIEVAEIHNRRIETLNLTVKSKK